jgi:peptidoglycan/LPS O-acetylase OafA/YrhL
MAWNQGLDLARTAAVFLVLYAHSQDILKGSLGWTTNPWLSAFDEVFRPGWWGVRIFFALSGYLIGREVLRILATGSMNQARLFLARRWLRTVPTFWIILLITVWANGFSFLPDDVISNALFLNTASIAGSDTSIIAVGWSLVIEEWSYAGLGVLVLAVSWSRWKPSENQATSLLGGIALVAVAASVVMRVQVGSIDNIGFDIIKKTASLQLDSLSYGVILACIQQRWPSGWNQLIQRGWLVGSLGWIGMTAVGAWLRTTFQLNVASPTTLDWQFLGGAIYPLSGLLCCCFCLGLWSFRWPNGITPIEQAAKLLARISYSVYLTHIPVRQFPAFQAERVGESGSAILWCSYVVTSIGIGYLCWQITERPFIALRRKLH